MDTRTTMDKLLFRTNRRRTNKKTQTHRSRTMRMHKTRGRIKMKRPCKCGKQDQRVLEKTTHVTYKLECLHCGIETNAKYTTHEIGEAL